MSKKIIVKVQLPLVTTGNPDHALVYSKDRSIFAEVPLRSRRELKELKKHLDEQFKGYFYGELDDKGGFILTGTAPWQKW